MELQWPLILFTTFIAWCGGLFGTQCLYVLRGKGEKTQVAAWITAAILLVVGGISVFLHLEHWERIFNGFGHITSGITQELICIVLIAIVALIFIIMLKKKGEVPRALAIIGLVVSILMVAVTGHSYMMPALPAWNSVFQVLSLVGAACLLGPATFVLIAHYTKDESDFSLSMVAGSAINLATTIVYVIAMVAASGSYTNMGYYFDPTRATFGMTDTASFSPLASGALPFTLIAIVCAVIALIAAVVGKKQGWKIWAPVAVICGVAAAICLRVVFYMAGGHLFVLF